MRFLSKVGLAGLVVVLAASSASAQRTVRTSSAAPAVQGGYWELGGDAGVAIGLDDPKSFSINVPVSQVRAGYYVSDVLSLEPTLRFFSSATKGFTAFSAWALGIGGLYHMSPDRKAMRVFVHPMIGFAGGSGGARTRTSLGAGFGMKKPAMNGLFHWRMEGGLNYLLKNGALPARTTIYGNFGMSLYTK